MENVESPMPGKILAVNIQVGQTVAEDDEVMILEAMKMENPIFCPVGGTIKEILVKVGDQVEEGTILAVIE